MPMLGTTSSRDQRMSVVMHTRATETFSETRAMAALLTLIDRAPTGTRSPSMLTPVDPRVYLAVPPICSSVYCRGEVATRTVPPAPSPVPRSTTPLVTLATERLEASDMERLESSGAVYGVGCATA